MCFDNQFLYDENEKIYIKCNRTNEEGTACDQCIEGYELGDEGYCVNHERSEEKQDETCIKCRQETTDIFYFCANKYFGCFETLVNACVKCDNIFDLYSCTECEEGYRLKTDGLCQKIYD